MLSISLLGGLGMDARDSGYTTSPTTSTASRYSSMMTAADTQMKVQTIEPQPVASEPVITVTDPGSITEQMAPPPMMSERDLYPETGPVLLPPSMPPSLPPSMPPAPPLPMVQEPVVTFTPPVPPSLPSSFPANAYAPSPPMRFSWAALSSNQRWAIGLGLLLVAGFTARASYRHRNR